MNIVKKEEKRNYDEARKGLSDDEIISVDLEDAINLTRLPAKTCVFCDKPLKEIGGNRLTAQHFRGVMLSKNKAGGGNKECPHKCIVLFVEPLLYMDFWGTAQEWTQTAIDSASKSYLNGERPWFCQVCGQRKCKKCSAPINYPMASEILHGDGNSSHAGIFPFDPGCINPTCGRYKEWAT